MVSHSSPEHTLAVVSNSLDWTHGAHPRLRQIKVSFPRMTLNIFASHMTQSKTPKTHKTNLDCYFSSYLFFVTIQVQVKSQKSKGLGVTLLLYHHPPTQTFHPIELKFCEIVSKIFGAISEFLSKIGQKLKIFC